MSTRRDSQIESASRGNPEDATIARRDFLKLGTLGTVGFALAGLPIMAGPFSKENLAGHLIPADKKLTSKWLASLVKRGEAEVFSGEDLKYIGMPVGGIGCGQIYLSGDGRLWHWDVFKSNYKREVHDMKLSSMTMGGHYSEPVEVGEEYNYQNGAEVQQGFAVRVKSEGDSFVRRLDKEDFPQVRFRGEYPVGRVSYEDSSFPAKVELEAFSPFIPLNEKDSALPVTVMRYTVTNTSDSTLAVDLAGWLENAVCPYSKDSALGERNNQLEQGKGRSSVLSTIDGTEAITQEHGYGSSALSVLVDEGIGARGVASLNIPEDPHALFVELDRAAEGSASKPLDETLVGGLIASVELLAGESKVVTFLVSWYFPLHQKATGGSKRLFSGRHYGPWFESAGDVADYVTENRASLIDGTLLWNKTWYDSTLPHWLLDRSMIPLDCVASQTFHWFDSGRPWAWEGVDCCGGTCTHVFQYAQAMSRVFPELERRLRERVDYGTAFNEGSGGIGFRGGSKQQVADDGQAGTILRVYREHQMSPDDAFLKRLWPRVKQSIEYLMGKDPDEDGLLTGDQPHTLDAAWNGKIAWISSMYLAALAAGEAMADEIGDDAFSKQCRKILDRGYKNIVSELFDGEYFIHKPAEKGDEDEGEHGGLNTNTGCHIDQVLGQSWAHQVGLGRIIPKKETVSALESLWKYNFAPDAGGYAIKHRAIEKSFRWYAMEGEAGLLMTTWPKGGAKAAIPGDELRSVQNPDVWTGPGGYFNECMNGFEYQVAGHMVAEGDPDSSLVEKGLAIMKAVHERYGASRRNPYNEIECSDHYARSMASYGIFLTACGFTHHGPKGQIGFSPKINPSDFKAPFTTAEGWGSFTQKIESGELSAELELRYGSLQLNEFSLDKVSGIAVTRADVEVDGKSVAVKLSEVSERIVMKFANSVRLKVGQRLIVSLGS